jgi:adenosylmethionine-8-amino-7-oxononanoate aminotransferase
MTPRIWHPFTQLRDFEPLGRVVGATGAWLHLADGRRVLDGISSWWVNIHGHSHPKIVAAITAQAAAFDQVILADFEHAPAIELTRRLVERLPGDLNHVFYSDNGSTAVEVAIKLAWQFQLQRGEHRPRLVAFEGAYHGDTLGAMRVGARDLFTAPFEGLLGPTTRLPWDDADAAEAFFATHGHEVCAFIVEPLLQGVAGMRVGRPDQLARIDAAVHKAGALLIADEVATGFGRTGTFWACEQAGIVPDLLAMSKGITGGTLPLGATACREELFRAFLGPDKRSAFLHGHSYCGNPITAAAALASLDLFEEERTLDRVAAISARYAAHAPAFAALPGVRGVRWLGGVFAFDLAGGPGGYLDPIGRRLQAAALQHGLYVRPLGDVAYLMPPFCVTEAELDQALHTLAACTQQVVTASPPAAV